MKKRYALLLAVISFIFGSYLSYYSLSLNIQATNDNVEALQNNIRTFTNTLSTTRAIDNLETTLEEIGYITYQENRNAPRSYLRDEYTKMIKTRVSKLNNVKQYINNKTAADKATLLLNNADKLLEELKSNY